MPITFACTCGQSMTVPDDFAGKKGKCKKCGALMTAPAKGSAKGPTRMLGKPAEVSASQATLSEANVSETNVDTEDDDGDQGKATGLKTGVVKFKCPSCQIELKVPLHLAGGRGKCRKCGSQFVSPVPEALKQARAKVAATAQKGPSLKDQFSVVKVRCSCGMTSAVLKGKAVAGEEKCPACDKPLAVTT